MMKKYKVWCVIGSSSFTYTIEADAFECRTSGVYYFRNTTTKQEWYLPINKTVIELVVN